MPSFVRPAWLALAFVATAMPASAQTWIYEADVPRPPGYEPRYNYEPRPYEPPTYESRAYAPAATARRLRSRPPNARRSIAPSYHKGAVVDRLSGSGL